MNFLAALCFAISFVSLGWFAVSSVRICADRQNRGLKVNYLWMRLLIIKYASQYRNMTLEETGRVGPLYYQFIGSINLAWIMALTGLILMKMA